VNAGEGVSEFDSQRQQFCHRQRPGGAGLRKGVRAGVAERQGIGGGFPDDLDHSGEVREAGEDGPLVPEPTVCVPAKEGLADDAAGGPVPDPGDPRPDALVQHLLSAGNLAAGAHTTYIGALKPQVR
jgi:hypothetical protein